MRRIHRRSPALRGAIFSLLYLGVSLVLAFPASAQASRLAAAWGVPLGPALFAATLLVCCALGGALWGGHVARTFGFGSRALHMTAHGALGFGMAAPVALYALTSAEGMLLERAQTGTTVPMHVAFGVVFPAATFAVVFGTVLALGIGARLRVRALGLALRGAAAAALAFLTVAALMDAAGWRVGAPGAEARFTMVVVMGLGLLAATLAGGATLGRGLEAARPPEPGPSGLSGSASSTPLAGDRRKEPVVAALPGAAELAELVE